MQRVERRVVVTGLGLISPVGNSVAEGWKNLLAGRTGIANITKFDASAYIGCVFSRLIMWIRLRSPKIKGAIFGFQKRV